MVLLHVICVHPFVPTLLAHVLIMMFAMMTVVFFFLLLRLYPVIFAKVIGLHFILISRKVLLLCVVMVTMLMRRWLSFNVLHVVVNYGCYKRGASF